MGAGPRMEWAQGPAWSGVHWPLSLRLLRPWCACVRRGEGPLWSQAQVLHQPAAGREGRAMTRSHRRGCRRQLPRGEGRRPCGCERGAPACLIACWWPSLGTSLGPWELFLCSTWLPT